MKLNLGTKAVFLSFVFFGLALVLWTWPQAASAASGHSTTPAVATATSAIAGEGGVSAPPRPEIPDKDSRIMAFFEPPPPPGGGVVVPTPDVQYIQQTQQLMDGLSPRGASHHTATASASTVPGNTSNVINPQDFENSIQIQGKPHIQGCYAKVASPFFSWLGFGDVTPPPIGTPRFSMALDVNNNGSAISGFTTYFVEYSGQVLPNVKGVRWSLEQGSYTSYTYSMLERFNTFESYPLQPTSAPREFVIPYGISYYGDLITGSIGFRIKPSSTAVWQRVQFYYDHRATPSVYSMGDLAISTPATQCSYDSVGYAIAHNETNITIAGFGSTLATPSTPGQNGCLGLQSTVAKGTLVKVGEVYETEITALPTVPAQTYQHQQRASAVSLDGHTFAVNGYEEVALTSRAYSLRTSNNEYIELANPVATKSTLAEAITPDGEFIIGTAFDPNYSQPYRTQAVIWDANNGSLVAQLGAGQGLSEFTLPYQSAGRDIAKVGSTFTVVGTVQKEYQQLDHPCLAAFSSIPSGFYSRNWMRQEAFIWKTGWNEMRRLQNYLQEIIPELSLAGVTLCDATAISADGSTVVGYGVRQDGSSYIPEAFMARIKPLYQAVPCNFTLGEKSHVGIVE